MYWLAVSGTRYPHLFTTVNRFLGCQMFNFLEVYICSYYPTDIHLPGHKHLSVCEVVAKLNQCCLPLPFIFSPEVVGSSVVDSAHFFCNAAKFMARNHSVLHLASSGWGSHLPIIEKKSKIGPFRLMKALSSLSFTVLLDIQVLCAILDSTSEA